MMELINRQDVIKTITELYLNDSLGTPAFL